MMIYMWGLVPLTGVLLGLLGGGGSILIVPLLIYGLKLSPTEAMSSSLFIVGITSIVACIGHYKKGNVQLEAGFQFALGGMIGAYLGSVISHQISSFILMMLFVLMMFVTGIAMVLPRQESVSVIQKPHKMVVIAIGFAIGCFAGMVGAGGGFMIVPAFHMLVGLSMSVSIATSLFVIAAQSLVGFVGHIQYVQLDYAILFKISILTVLGTLFGLYLSPKIPSKILKKGFGVMVIMLSLVVLWKEIM